MTQTTETSTERNTQLALRFLDLIDRRQFEEADALLDPGFQLHLGREQLSREQTMGLVRSVHQAFSDFRHDVQETLAVGDRVVVRIVDRAIHTGEFQGVPATGRPIAIGQISIFRIAGDRIAEIREEADMLALMQQIGAIPAAGAAGT